MKMYNKFRQYQEKPKNRQPPRTSRTIEFVRGMLFYATPLGCLWWFAELKYAGAAFFLLFGNTYIWYVYTSIYQYLWFICKR